jgi:hypothetical protein
MGHKPRDTVVNRASLAGILKTCSALERVWILALGRCNEAVEEGQALLAGSTIRLFEEGKYRDAAAEFEWSRDLFGSYGYRHSRTEASERAMHRARELAAGPTPEQQHIQTMATERRKPPTMHEAGISILDTDRYPSGTTTHQHVAGTTL